MVTSRRMRPFRRLVGAGAAALVAGAALLLESAVARWRRPPAFEPSSETTRVTGPTAADGFPDYLDALLALEPPAIAAADNAAAALWEVSPERPSAVPLVDVSRAGLGEADRRPPGERFAPLPSGPATGGPSPLPDACIRAPWVAADHPSLSAWLERNALPMDIVAAGARRPGWCPPRCLPGGRPPVARSGDTPDLMALVLPVETDLGTIGAAFLCRAMMRLGAGDVAAARNDLETPLRLGRAAAGSPGSFMGRMAGQRLLERSARAVAGLVAGPGTDDALLAPLQACVRDAIAACSTAGGMEFERMMILDAIIHTFADPARLRADVGSAADAVRVDLGRMLAAANRDIDTLDAVLRLPRRTDRVREAAEFHAAVAQRQSDPLPRRRFLEPLYPVVTEAIYRQLSPLLLPDIRPMIDAADRARAALVVAECALAVERFRLREARLPGALMDLVPEFLPAAPVDPFTDGMPGYRADDGGWVVWSGEPPDADGAEDPRGLTIRRHGRD